MRADLDIGTPASPTLRRVLRGSLCSGCGGCAAVAPEAIQMRISTDGYLRPAQRAEVGPEAEARIGGICPGVRLEVRPEGRRDHLLWGPHVAIRAGHATAPALRRLASSGGTLSAMLTFLLDTAEIDYVLQVGAAPDLPIGNRTVVSRDAAAVAAAAGSRYAPSAPLAGLGEHLAAGRRFAFVGKPCDVAALQAMKAFDSRVAECIPYVFSFFCAGVPSLAGAREVLDRMGVEEAEVTGFRYRGDGWPGFATATLRDGRQAQMSYADSWGGVLSRHVQFRCKICPDGTGSLADVVCADAWEADERGYPVFAERDGVSLTLSRTERGDELVQRAAAAGYIQLERFDPDRLAAIQPGQRQKRRYVLSRLAALRVLGRPAPAYRGFHLLRNALAAGIRGNLRNFLGTLRRAVLGPL